MSGEVSHPPAGSGRRLPAILTLAGAVVACVAAIVFRTQTHEQPLRALLVAGGAVAIAAVLWGLRRRAWGMALVAVALAVVLVAGTGAWIGANSPQLTWFGALVSHGDRRARDVALTFDDGPNITTTLRVRDILDAHGVKGAFFSVGKAVDARPEISRALVDDGHLLGDHSYNHDYWHWLDPWYRELGHAQATFRARLHVCPALYRPPHGQHTPLLALALHRRGMTMVGWDVSAGDFATTNARLVARRVLSRVRPGSIIDLHDGLDGRVEVNRSVLTRALPLILDGLQARGLHVVRLDALIKRAGYLPTC
jgi:peptidoglycan/xylan/chitin deacetylase (PgdA/CDA1 family)